MEPVDEPITYKFAHYHVQLFTHNHNKRTIIFVAADESWNAQLRAGMTFVLGIFSYLGLLKSSEIDFVCSGDGCIDKNFNC